MGTLRRIIREAVNNFPQHKRGEVVVFSNDLDYQTVGAIAKKLGYEVVGELNKFGNSSLPKEWNEQIDDIISRLEDIKYL